MKANEEQDAFLFLTSYMRHSNLHFIKLNNSHVKSVIVKVVEFF